MKKKIISMILLIVLIMTSFTNIALATMSLNQLQNAYPTGSKWRDTYEGFAYEFEGRTYESGRQINAKECAGFAALMYYNYYGIDPYGAAERVYDVEQTAPGDIVRYNDDPNIADDGHSVWVLSRNGETVQVAECNYDRDCTVRWYQTKSMNELRTKFRYIYKAPYVLGGTEPSLNAPSGIQANLSENTINVSWNRPAMASGYIVKIFSADSVAKNDYTSPVTTKEIKFPHITSTTINFYKTGEYYVYVYTKRGDRVSSSGGNGIKISSYPITSVEITSNETGNMLIGDKRKFTAKVLPENTTTTNKSITWSVSNSSVASVTQDGIVTALKDGGTYLYAKASNGVSANVFINVTYTQVPIYGISISGLQRVYEGSTTNLSATVLPSNATGDKTITWSSYDDSIATVDSNGVVTGVKEGKTRIKAESVNGMMATWIMEVKPGVKVTDITLNKTSLELLKGDSEKLKATISPWNATNRTVTWSSSNSNVAFVDSSGNITAKEEGTAVITATAGNYSKTCNVKVYDVKVILSPKTTYMFSSLSENLQLSAKLSTEESTSFTWKSSNEKVLKVDKDGKITPVTGGFANITVTDSKYNKTAMCECYVQVPVTLSDGSKAYVGDMNKDGYFNLVDSAMILDAYKNGTTADDYLLGDLNGDGFVNSADGAISKELYMYDSFFPGKYYPITSVNLNKQELSLKTGNSEILKATIEPESTTDSPKLTWSSSDESIAKVNENGTVTAISPGTAIITVKTSNNNIETKCTVTVTSSSALNVEDKDSIIGDVNADGEADLIDCALLLRHAKGIEILDNEQAKRADINNDNEVDLIDYALLLRHVKGIELLD